MENHENLPTLLREGLDALRDSPVSQESLSRAVDRAKRVCSTVPVGPRPSWRRRLIDALAATALLAAGLLPSLSQIDVTVEHARLRIAGLGPLEIVLLVLTLGAATFMLNRSTLSSPNVPAKARRKTLAVSALLVLMLISGALAIHLGLQYRSSRRQDLAAQTVRQLGWSVTKQQGENWSIQAVGSTVGDDDLARLVPILRKFPTISLDLRGSQITDAGLRHLRDLDNLFFLGLAQTQITDEALPHLATMDRLRGVDLSETRVSDAGMDSLAALPLEALTLNKTNVTDEGLRRLPRSFPAYILNLREMPITDKGVRQLASWPNLKSLDLSHTEVTGEAFQKFGASRIQMLNLSQTEISDATLMNLASLPDLWEVHLQGTSVTDDAIQHFREAAPTVAVFR